MKEDNRKKQLIRLDAETHLALKRRAVDGLTTVQNIIVRLIKEYLNGSI